MEPVFRYGMEDDYPKDDDDPEGRSTQQWVADLRTGHPIPEQAATEHRYQGCGDGRVLIHRSSWDSWRLIWLPHLPEDGDPVIRYGDEADFAAVAGRSLQDVLGWTAEQPWGQNTTPRPFEMARQRVLNQTRALDDRRQ